MESMSRPVLLRISSSMPPHPVVADARRCGGPARRWRLSIGSPVSRSHTTVVSRWLVMPTPRRLEGEWALASTSMRRTSAGQNVDGVVFHPAGLRVVLIELMLGYSGNRPRFIEKNGSRTRRSLVERQNVAHCVRPAFGNQSNIEGAGCRKESPGAGSPR